MKAKETKKKDFSISSVNGVIGKLNKMSLLVIIVVYIFILSLILSLIGSNISYINEPSYDHVFYNEEITPQLTIVGRRTVSSNDDITLRYNVNAYITSRYEDGTAPKLDIENFRMFAITSKELTNTKNLSNYYFTEQSGYTTPVTHTYTIDNSSVAQHPSSMYVRLAYKKDGVKKIATFKETLMMQPTDSDKSIMQQWYDSNKESTYVDENGNEQVNKAKSAVNIYASSDKTVMGTFEVAVAKVSGSETNNSKVSVRIKINNQSSKKFHIDMQTWAVTESGEYLPLIGGYNYTSQVSMFSSDTEVPAKVKVKYIAMKLLYRDANNRTENATYLFQDYSKIKETLSTNPDTPDSEFVPNSQAKETIIVLSIILGTVVIVVAVVVTISIVEKKKKEQENEETQKNLDSEEKL